MLLADPCLMSGFSTLSITPPELAEDPLGDFASTDATACPATTLGSPLMPRSGMVPPQCADANEHKPFDRP